MLREARFLGPARTPRAYALWSLGGFSGLVRGGATSVDGELYEVDAHGTEAEADLLEPRHITGCAPIASGSWRTHRKEHHR